MKIRQHRQIRRLNNYQPVSDSRRGATESLYEEIIIGIKNPNKKTIVEWEEEKVPAKSCNDAKNLERQKCECREESDFVSVWRLRRTFVLTAGEQALVFSIV